MERKLYVGNLSFATVEDELKQWFEQCGPVQNVSVVRDRYSGRSKGFGFVEMGTEDGASKAIEQMNGKELGGRTIKVAEAKSPGERPARSFGDRPHRSGGFRNGRGSM